MRSLRCTEWSKAAADHFIIARVIRLPCVRSLRESLNLFFIAIECRQVTHFLLAIWWVAHQIINMTSLLKSVYYSNTGRENWTNRFKLLFPKMKGQFPHQKKDECLFMNAKQRERKVVLWNGIFSQYQLTFIWLTRDDDTLMHLDLSCLILTLQCYIFQTYNKGDCINSVIQNEARRLPREIETRNINYAYTYF